MAVGLDLELASMSALLEKAVRDAEGGSRYDAELVGLSLSSDWLSRVSSFSTDDVFPTFSSSSCCTARFSSSGISATSEADIRVLL